LYIFPPVIDFYYKHIITYKSLFYYKRKRILIEKLNLKNNSTKVFILIKNILEFLLKVDYTVITG